MTAKVETKVTCTIPIVHREVAIRNSSQIISDEVGYKKFPTSLFHENPNISQAIVDTEPERTQIVFVVMDDVDGVIHCNPQQPSAVIFDDQLLFFHRRTTVTHINSPLPRVNTL